MFKREATWMLLVPALIFAVGLLLALVLPAAVGRARHHERAAQGTHP